MSKLYLCLLKSLFTSWPSYSGFIRRLLSASMDPRPLESLVLDAALPLACSSTYKLCEDLLSVYSATFPFSAFSASVASLMASLLLLEPVGTRFFGPRHRHHIRCFPREKSLHYSFSGVAYCPSSTSGS